MNRRLTIVIAVVAVLAVFVLGCAVAVFTDSGENQLRSSAGAATCDASALIDQAKVELLLTTKSGVWYANHLGTTGHWKNAFALLDQAKTCGSATTTTTAPTTTPVTTTAPTTTTVPTTTTASTTTAPTPGVKCFASPGSCGFPDPAFGNVGVPPGTTLTPSGSINVTADGTVIDGKDVSGTINVNAKNVTIKNTRVTGTGVGCGPTNTCGNYVIGVGTGASVTISNVELTANPPTTVEHGIRNANGGTITLDHVYQHGNIDALCFCGNGSVKNSYSFIYLAISSDHLENLYLDDSTFTIDHNTFFNHAPQTANIFGNTNNGQDAACSNKLTITNNLLAGGGFSMYPCAHGTSAGTSTATITGNRFARCKTPEVQGGGGTWFCSGGEDSFGYYPNAGSFGYHADTYCNAPGWSWSGNVWDDNNVAIPC